MMDRQTEGWPCPRTAEQPQRPSAGRALALRRPRGRFRPAAAGRDEHGQARCRKAAAREPG